MQEIGGTLQKMGRTSAQVERRLKFMREHFPEAMFSLTPEMIEAIRCLPDVDEACSSCGNHGTRKRHHHFKYQRLSG